MECRAQNAEKESEMLKNQIKDLKEQLNEVSLSPLMCMLSQMSHSLSLILYYLSLLFVLFWRFHAN